METGRRLSRRERLFDCYAANLSACRREYTESFACPLCLRLFDREALAARDVTEEHIVPSSLGGRMVTLTCRECNCTAGSGLESHLVRRLERDDFVAGISPKPLLVRVSIGQGEIAGEVHRYPDRIELHGIPEMSKPELHALAVSSLRSGVLPPDMSLRLPLGFKGLPSWIAVLRMGYLLAFCYFGYGYIMHPNVAQVRDQIKRPDAAAISVEAVRCVEQWPYVGNLLGLLYAPSRLRCFFAVLELSTDVVRHYGVVLPGLDAQSRDIYNRWGESAGAVAELQPKAVFLPLDPDRVCDPNKADFASRFWRTWTKPLLTWAGRSEFHYDGSVDTDTTIWYGSKLYHTRVTGQEYGRLLQRFGGRTVVLGTSREPPPGSVGAWLQARVTKRAIASYVGPILVHEGYAERVPSDTTKIRFN